MFHNICISVIRLKTPARSSYSTIQANQRKVCGGLMSVRTVLNIQICMCGVWTQFLMLTENVYYFGYKHVCACVVSDW